jgi:hypothetical protein
MNDKLFSEDELLSLAALLIGMAANMRHALGLDGGKQPYRNHYCGSTPGLELAVKLGFCNKFNVSLTPDPGYSVTDLGKKFLGVRQDKK